MESTFIDSLIQKKTETKFPGHSRLYFCQIKFLLIYNTVTFIPQTFYK